MFRFTSYFLLILLLCPVLVFAEKSKEVVVYTALDQIFSEPILKEFEKQYNITVKAVYDIEAVKTTGLVNRLLAERKNPRCDVFWNNEIMRTIMLKRKGVLSPYFSPSAKDIPGQFKDATGYWSGFAARARVLVVNKDLVEKDSYPSSISDLSGKQWLGKAAIALPLFGTTSTHIAAMYSYWGADETNTYLNAILANDIKVVDGNSVVRDMVGNGQVLIGLTDTDDANVGIESGMPLEMILPDQHGMGTLLIPNTVAVIKGAPHPKEAELLVDFLLSKEVEEKLSHSSSAQIPLRSDVHSPAGRLALNDLVPLAVDFEKVADVMEESTQTVQVFFVK